ncbi:MAG: hypothetical protein OER86_05760 [Phycisphaerae bacterium]|nr:hypothetical protein [Phycisphaerae bacterium]
MKASPTPDFSVFILPIGAGIAAVVAVYLGVAFEWENFCPRSGYFGTQWLNGFLYGIGGWQAIAIVAFLWFMYAFVGMLILQVPLHAIWWQDEVD